MAFTQTRHSQQCITECGECARTCVECSYHCLNIGGGHASVEHQRIMHDCAAICAMAVSFMVRGSDHAGSVCGVCADICRECGESCGQLAGSDREINECAQTCLRCAESCAEMAENDRG